MRHLISLFILTVSLPILSLYASPFPQEVITAIQTFAIDRPSVKQLPILSAPHATKQIFLSEEKDDKGRRLTIQKLQTLPDPAEMTRANASTTIFPQEEQFAKTTITFYPTQESEMVVTRAIALNKAKLPPCEVKLLNKHPVIIGTNWYLFAKSPTATVDVFTQPDKTVRYSITTQLKEKVSVKTGFTQTLYYGEGSLDETKLKKILSHETTL